jgi:putative endonuclease
VLRASDSRQPFYARKRAAESLRETGEVRVIDVMRSISYVVTVKTRAANALVAGFYAVDRRKKKVMLRACTAYLRGLGSAGHNLTYRFDVIEVSRATAKDEPPVVRHFENIPLFPKDFRL